MTGFERFLIEIGQSTVKKKAAKKLDRKEPFDRARIEWVHNEMFFRSH
jgi:hypothetical protein